LKDARKSAVIMQQNGVSKCMILQKFRFCQSKTYFDP